MAAGALDEARAEVLADVREHTSPAVARAIEGRLPPEAASLTTGRSRKRALAALLEADADAVDERRQQAQRQADVRCHPSPTEGMGTPSADLPAQGPAGGPGSTSRAARGHGCAARTSVARCGPVTPSTRTAQPVLDPVRRPTIS
ncbi:hypothetical protein SAMN05660642_04434 [Geodermatophilus siccatus]|uniref:DUF222 domain-containing protein n=1 Tax=Geodermatophilus siccatus TaxID=1137991 RepID=A0A1G9ZZV5_9ACTN|nr:hypothetical protein SAMN05660642_04434 [Geodermatophilus siccatus]